MRAAVFQGPGDIRVEDLPEPEPRDGDLVVDVLACGVCGSDLESWRTGASVSPGQVMGHEFAGRAGWGAERLGIAPGTLVAVRPLLPCGTCRACSRGDIQLCDGSLGASLGYGLPGGFAERIVVPSAAVGSTVFPLPSTLDPSAAAMVEPLGVALRGIRHAGDAARGTVLVTGLGPIGLCTVLLLTALGAERVLAADVSPARRDAAARLGALPIDGPIADAVRAVTGPGSYGLGAAADAAIDCSGSPDAFAACIKSTRAGGVVVLVAHSTGPFAVKSGRVIEKELTVQGSFAYRDELADVARLIADGVVDPSPLISHTFALDDIGEAFAQQARAAESLKVVVTP